MPCYSWTVHCDIGRGEKNRIQHQSGHDGIQELIWSIWICLLFLLLSVCMGLKQRHSHNKCIFLNQHVFLGVFFFLSGKLQTRACFNSAKKMSTFSKSYHTFILSARSPKATIMSPGLLIFFSTLTVWEKRVGEYDRPSFGTVAQKFSSSLPKTKTNPFFKIRNQCLYCSIQSAKCHCVSPPENMTPVKTSYYAKKRK